MKGNSQLEFVDSKIIPKARDWENKLYFYFIFINNCVPKEKPKPHIYNIQNLDLDELKLKRTTKILNNLNNLS